MMIDLKELARAEREWAVTVLPDIDGGAGATTVDRHGDRIVWRDSSAAFASVGSDDPRERAHALVCAQWYFDRAAGITHRAPRPRPARAHPVPCPPKKLKVRRRVCLCHSADGGWKRMYATLDRAQEVALRMSAKNGTTMNPFACPSGEGFHIATSVADKRTRRTLSSPHDLPDRRR